MYKSLLTLNEEYIFENFYLVVVNINKGTNEMVNMKILRQIITNQRHNSI